MGMKCLYCKKEFKQEKFECLCPTCTEQERQRIIGEIARLEESKKAIPRDGNGNFVLTCGRCGKEYSTVTLEGPQICFKCETAAKEEIAAGSEERQAEERAKVDFAENMD